MNVADPKLYSKVKKRADRIYEKHGLYKSAWIQKEYKRLGGKYIGKKPGKSQGLQRWLQGEQWVDVVKYLTTGEKVMCGSRNKSGPCRPLKRVSSKTPPTISELVKKHGKKEVLKLARRKQRDPAGRANWKHNTFSPSS